jgi:hypothetical protein
MSILHGILFGGGAPSAASTTRQAAIAQRDAMANRRVRASMQTIEDTIAVGQRRGLTPASVSHYADGSTVIHFMESGNATRKKANTGWEDL